MDDGRTPDDGHPISSPCEPKGSGELKKSFWDKLGYTEAHTNHRDLKSKDEHNITKLIFVYNLMPSLRLLGCN